AVRHAPPPPGLCGCQAREVQTRPLGRALCAPAVCALLQSRLAARHLSARRDTVQHVGAADAAPGPSVRGWHVADDGRTSSGPGAGRPAAAEAPSAADAHAGPSCSDAAAQLRGKPAAPGAPGRGGTATARGTAEGLAKGEGTGGDGAAPSWLAKHAPAKAKPAPPVGRPPPPPVPAKYGFLAKHLPAAKKPEDGLSEHDGRGKSRAGAAAAGGSAGEGTGAAPSGVLPATLEAAAAKLEEVEQKRRAAAHQPVSEKLLAAARRKQREPAYVKMLAGREQLPTYRMKEAVLEAIQRNQVTVVSGATGCGKTTQIPQLVFEEAVRRGEGGACSVVCTQPRRLSAIAVAERVAAERVERLGDVVGYSIRLEAKKSAATRIHFCTTGILLRRLQSEPSLPGVSHVIVDEVHERDLNSDFLLVILRDLLVARPDIKVVCMSATVNASLFSQYFEQAVPRCPVVEIPGRTFPVEEYRLEDAIEATSYVCEPFSEYAKGMSDTKGGKGGLRGGRGQALVQDSLDRTVQMEVDPDLAAKYPGYSDSTLRCLQVGRDATCPNFRCCPLCSGTAMALRCLHSRQDFADEGGQFLLVPLHSTLSSEEQHRTFSTPPPGVRKVVIATNIAETSITIDDVVFVVDGCRVKENRYDPATRMASLDTVWISRASARQRRGRAGRVKPGYCFHLYSSEKEGDLADFTQPEILRVPLEQLCLQIKALRLGNVAEFLARAIEPPSEAAIRLAVAALQELAAVDSDGELTALGHHLAELPVDARIGKMMVYGAIFGCLDPVLTIAAGLSVRNPFVAPIDKREAADKARRALAQARGPQDLTPHSDHCALLRAYNGWLTARGRGASGGKGGGKGAGRTTPSEARYLAQNFLSGQVLRNVADMKRQFAELLGTIGFVKGGPRVRAMEKEAAFAGGDGVMKATGVEANQHNSSLELVRAVLCAGLYPNVARIDARAGFLTPAASALSAQAGGQHHVFVTRGDGEVAVHPSSLNFNCEHFPHRFLLFHEKVLTTKVYVRETTIVGAYAMLLFAGDVAVDHQRTLINVDRWLQFRAPPRVAVLFKELRAELDKLLMHKIDQPDLTVAGGGAEGGSVIDTIIQLLRSEEGASDKMLAESSLELTERSG
ncbi:hypothetical protein CYMTET_36081, partial [Cymbomonas tetramitiformis]